MSSITKSKFFIFICILINASFLNCSEEIKMDTTKFEKRLASCESLVLARLVHDKDKSSGFIMNIMKAYSLKEQEAMSRAKTFLNLSCNKKITEDLVERVKILFNYNKNF